MCTTFIWSIYDKLFDQKVLIPSVVITIMKQLAAAAAAVFPDSLLSLISCILPRTLTSPRTLTQEREQRSCLCNNSQSHRHSRACKLAPKTAPHNSLKSFTCSVYIFPHV